MSRRAKREARAARRWREQVARMIALACNPGQEHDECGECLGSGRRTLALQDAGYSAECGGCGGSGRFIDEAARLILAGAQSGGRFDVAAAREYGERLVALEEQQAIFEHWTSIQGKPGLPDHLGLGPYNREPGAFVPPCRSCRATPGSSGHGPCYECNGYPERAGGWPGPLARTYGWEECKACEGKPRQVMRGCEYEDAILDPGCAHRRDGEHFHDCAKVVWTCPECKGRGRTRRHGIPPGFANGRSLARLGRRLLAALEGQPSECQRCHGDGRLLALGPEWRERLVKCEDCRGTGHNLSGSLPLVEWMAMPSLRRKLADMPNPNLHVGAPGGDWVDRLIERGGESLLDARDTPLRTELAWPPEERPLRYLVHVEGRIAADLPLWDMFEVHEREETRVVPRGEHRTTCDHPATQSELDAWHGRKPQGDWFETETEHAHAVAEFESDTSRLPRWRRGELKHAEQRRERAERARRQAMETIAQSTPYTAEQLLEANDRFMRDVTDRTHGASPADADRLLMERDEEIESLAAALDIPVAEVREQVRGAITGAPGDVQGLHVDDSGA